MSLELIHNFNRTYYFRTYHIIGAKMLKVKEMWFGARKKFEWNIGLVWKVYGCIKNGSVQFNVFVFYVYCIQYFSNQWLLYLMMDVFNVCLV